MKNSITSNIVLNGLELNINLGWLEAERLQKQPVIIDIKINFIQPPKACETDDLTDTFCYGKLISHLEKTLVARDFFLVEHLGYELYQTIKKYLNDASLVSVRVTKKPPIAILKKGVSFFYGDENWK